MESFSFFLLVEQELILLEPPSVQAKSATASIAVVRLRSFLPSLRFLFRSPSLPNFRASIGPRTSSSGSSSCPSATTSVHTAGAVPSSTSLRRVQPLELSSCRGWCAERGGAGEGGRSLYFFDVGGLVALVRFLFPSLLTVSVGTLELERLRCALLGTCECSFAIRRTSSPAKDEKKAAMDADRAAGREAFRQQRRSNMIVRARNFVVAQG